MKFWRGEAWAKERVIRFWCLFGSQSGSRVAGSGSRCEYRIFNIIFIYYCNSYKEPKVKHSLRRRFELSELYFVIYLLYFESVVFYLWGKLHGVCRVD